MTANARAVLNLQVSEKQFQQQILDLARLYGWKVHAVWNSRHSPAGWPDLFMIRDGVVLAWEVKREDGRAKPTEAQRAWLHELRQIPGMRWWNAMVVRPSSWDLIVSILSGAGERRVVAERDRQWVASEAMRDAADARIAALETDLQAAAAALVQVIGCWNSAAQEPAGCVCDVCINVADAVLSRPTVATLREDSHDD